PGAVTERVARSAVRRRMMMRRPQHQRLDHQGGQDGEDHSESVAAQLRSFSVEEIIRRSKVSKAR
ncbi:MAG: hypothetical protein AB7O38_10095, partial [Pirellulaceae bacterium]